MRFWVRALIIALVAPAISGFVAWRSWAEPDAPPHVAKPSFPGGASTPSNITPGDYVGPEACSDCHEDNYRSWLGHPHRRMNQLATEATVIGDFDGRSVEADGVTARFARAPGGEYTVSLERPGSPRRAYRVTRTIGSRFKQFYAGVVTEGAPVGKHRPDDEVVLPFGFWKAQRRWMPVTYFDSYGGSGREDDPVLRSACAFCHNTVPYLYRLGVDAPQLTGFLPTDVIADPVGLRQELAKTVDLHDLRGFPPGIQSRLDLESQLVTVGISCESCHFGARAHAIDAATYRFGPSSPHVALRPADPKQSAERKKENPWVVNGICRQCHSSDGPFYPDGSSTENSREALELDHGACASRIACTDCHDPHQAGPADEAGPDRPDQVAACTRCHDAYRDKRVASTHARHAPAQASCLDCHMPRITHGVTRTVRSHRISIPGDPRMLAVAAPNACNGCHADKSVAWTMAELLRGWGRKIEPQPTWAQAWGGSLDTPAMDAWAKSADPHTVLALIEVLGRRHDDDSLVRLAALLDDPAETTRTFAAMAIGRRIGRWLDVGEIDVMAPSKRRKAQIAALLPQLRSGAAALAHPPRVSP
jgi:hypothetical protein